MATVALTHGAARLEVVSVTTIEDLAREAETQFGLQPESYSFFDEYGMVEGTKLRRALQGPCVLEVRERPEWQRMREMSAQINALVAAQQGMAAHVESEIEARVAARMQPIEERLCRIEQQVEQALAPVVQSVALSQIDLSTKLESVSSKLESVDVHAMQARLDNLEQSLAALPAQMKHENKEIDSRLEAACARAESTADELEELYQKSAAIVNDMTRPTGSPAGRRRSDGTSTPSRGQFAAGPQWQDFANPKRPAGLYTTKSWGEAALEDLASSPLVGSILSPGKLERKTMQGCKSLPFLPRVC